MIKLKGQVTKTEDAIMQVTDKEFRDNVLREFTASELVDLAKTVWLKSKGLSYDSELRKDYGNTYKWYQYEDNGSHYSGYFDVEGKYVEGDELIQDYFEKLFKELDSQYKI